MSTPTNLPKILTLYRSLYRNINKLPKKYQREEGIDDLREEFRKPLTPATPLSELIENGYKRLSFLQMQTGGKSGFYKVRYNTDKTTNVVTKQETTDSKIPLPRPPKGSVEEKARHSNWMEGNMDPDQVRKHDMQLRHMRFRNNEHAKGIF